MINVPTMVWIDEAGRIVRPNDQQFGTDMFVQMHGKPSAPFLAALRAWVTSVGAARRPRRSRSAAPDARASSCARRVPSRVASPRARPDRGGRVSLRARGRARAERLDDPAGPLPIRGKNPMGPEFFELFREWEAAGKPGYETLAAQRNR